MPTVLASHLCKIFNTEKQIVAVNDLSFYCNKGECLAFLGTSGAGKTTTFKLLTNDIVATEGTIFINGREISSNFSLIRKQIGYAPQYESAFMSLTVRENLEFYSKIKGISSEIRKPLITKIINELHINQYSNVEAGNLSGGNKRKLTVAIALLGNPSIVLMDEPSTGVDPQARRFMWQVIQKLTRKNTAVLLTTHSIEEAEHLCTKMAMMISGNFCCIGAPQELKQNFSKGYEIQINVPLPSEIDEINFLKENGVSEEKLDKNQIQSIFERINRADLIPHLSLNGNASHIFAELSQGNKVNPKIVANFILVEQIARNFALDLASEFDSVKIMEHLGNYFKFRITKNKAHHTIGFLFGVVQDLVKKYKIEQYSTSQTSLNQIFNSFSKKEDVFF